MSEVTAYKFQTLAARIDTALDIQTNMYGAWKEVATEAFNTGAKGWIYHALLRKKDGREVTAARKLQSFKTENPDGYKEAKEDSKRIREMVQEKVILRFGDNDKSKATARQTIKRIIDDVAAMAGMPAPEATGSNGGRTHYDHVSEALRSLRNHLGQVEPGQCLELLALWSEFEEAAINDGVLKEAD